MKLFVVDDNQAFLDAVNLFFAPYNEFTIVGQWRDVGTDDQVEDLIVEIEISKPDIILMDFNFSLVNRPDDYGIELTRKICGEVPWAKIVILTEDHGFNDEFLSQKLFHSFVAGAVGYLQKSATDTWAICLKESVSSEIEHKNPPHVLLSIIEERFRRGHSKSVLNKKEVIIINQLSEGHSVIDISRNMNLSRSGVTYHIQNACAKLETKNPQGLVGKAFREGYIF